MFSWIYTQLRDAHPRAAQRHDCPVRVGAAHAEDDPWDLLIQYADLGFRLVYQLLQLIAFIWYYFVQLDVSQVAVDLQRLDQLLLADERFSEIADHFRIARIRVLVHAPNQLVDLARIPGQFA
ncbi:hypothetical protein BE21_52750 [Sorangium cellulosum]|uniref:Uncharacterized protein n=1 Tax=Sorangium cellulosum TaxID=56 RepID=A0A150TF78_SORCE|nr:hypothetical protein BE21_52750 [Sorangium cellulosum]